MDHAPLYQPKRSLIALMAIAASCPFAQAGDGGAVGTSSALGSSYAGPGSYYQSDAARIAMARREAQTQEAMQLLAEGRNLYREGKYKEALDKYNAAYNMLPSAPINDQRKEAIANHIGRRQPSPLLRNTSKWAAMTKPTSFSRTPQAQSPERPSLPSRRSNT